MTRGKENDENRAKATESKSRASTSSQSTSAEETIDIESVDGPVHSDTEYTEDGRPIRKRKATIPFDEDTDMDTDELLEKEIKSKKKPLPKPKTVKPNKAVKDEGSTVKAPKKTTKKPTRSAFSDDEEAPGKYSVVEQQQPSLKQCFSILSPD